MVVLEIAVSIKDIMCMYISDDHISDDPMLSVHRCHRQATQFLYQPPAFDSSVGIYECYCNKHSKSIVENNKCQIVVTKAEYATWQVMRS